MLSKSSARLFFVGGTAVFSLTFLALTVDTVRQVPERSNASEMSEAVIRGHNIWNDNNCMGCHTLLGEGAYYAPELTKVVERRGEPWLRLFLKDPQAMFPGRRKMVQYNFSDDEIEDLLAFFKWIRRIDTNGFPPEPDLVPTRATTLNQAVAAVDMDKMPQMMSTVCISCHAIAGQGGNVGPPLDDVAARYSRTELDLWLADPQKVKPGTAMPNLQMPDTVREELVDYLMNLNPGGKQ